MLILLFSYYFLQNYSQFIKSSLRLSLQSKRKASTGDSSGAESSKFMKRDNDSSDDDNDSKSNKSGVSNFLINQVKTSRSQLTIPFSNFSV